MCCLFNKLLENMIHLATTYIYPCSKPRYLTYEKIAEHDRVRQFIALADEGGRHVLVLSSTFGLVTVCVVTTDHGSIYSSFGRDREYAKP